MTTTPPPEPDEVRAVASRWRRHNDIGFGQPFKYTDSADLPTTMDKRHWWQRLWPRRRQRPIGWAVTGNATAPVAYQMTPKASDYRNPRNYVAAQDGPKVSPVEPTAIVPVYDDTMILHAAQNELDHPEPDV